MIAVDTDREHYIDVVAIANAAAAAERARCAEVFALRCVCWQNGYRPLGARRSCRRGAAGVGGGPRPLTTSPDRPSDGVAMSGQSGSGPLQRPGGTVAA